ncbi:MAG: helix-hairpin-helix domain-containing protein [Planctomycetota bacterium]|nr:helix-hairpin-helix domain-containing protein [Planctomycetota bacterium]
MQDANEADEVGTRDQEWGRVVRIRTQAFAALLILIVVWTLGVVFFGGRENTSEQAMPGELIVDLNDATEAELNLLPGVGEKLASDILKYRDNVGGFRSIEELMNIRGIKEGRLLSLKKYIRVSEKHRLTK